MNTDPVRCVYHLMKRFPFVTFALIIANALAFNLELAGGGFPVCQEYGIVPAGSSFHLVTYAFLHDPAGLKHIVGNMAVLALVGPIVESELGAFVFTLLYLAAAVAGGLLHCVVDASATAPLIGASGAIFGLLAVLAVLRPRLLGFVVGLAALNIWAAFHGGSGDVSFGCHIGGLCVGTVFAFFCRPVTEEAA